MRWKCLVLGWIGVLALGFVAGSALARAERAEERAAQAEAWAETVATEAAMWMSRR